jgi:hypothetical protein
MDNLTNLNINETFQRLLQRDPDDDKVIDGTGSIYLIPTSSIKNWASSINSTVAALGYITENGIVFTTKSNTGSINLKGNINVDGDVNLYEGITLKTKLDNNGTLWLSDFNGDPSTLPDGTFFYSGSEFYFVGL